METFQTLRPFRGRAALLATACLIAPLTAGEIRSAANASAAETARRSTAIAEAQELLLKGDESYTAGRYSDAVEAYAGARELLPDAPVTAELRAAATDRYAQASVEHARELARKGDVAAAKSTMAKVLEKSVAPTHAGALAFRDQLDDPIRTNPALTKEHVSKVDSVRRLLYTAQGAYDLGDFDKATSTYEQVLRLDPTNSAARRGMEKVAGAKSNYQKAAYDHTRAEMLAQVDSQWELQVPATDFDVGTLLDGTSDSAPESISLKNKLDRIIIPKIALDQATLDEALDFLRLRSQENDTFDRQGVNFAVNLGSPDSPDAQRVRALRFDLRLSNVPLSQVLKYLTNITQTAYKTDDYSVIITPLSSSSADLVTRTYRVPGNFLDSMGSSAAAAVNDDPFASEPSRGSLLPTQMGAQELLAQQGISFPDGASAVYLKASNSLRVVNTEANQEFIAEIVDMISKTEPVMVSVTVTMIKTQQTNLQELGFDWLLDNFGFGGKSWVPGASKLNLGGGTVGNGGNLDDIAIPTGTVTRNPITAGNRSGSGAITGDSIDNLINDQSGRQTGGRAPGIVSGSFSMSDAQVQLLMRGLDQKKGVDLMARPAVVTRSGQSSSIITTREMIFPTEYEPPELPNTVEDTGGGFTPVTPAHPTAFDTREVGVSLEVTPVVDQSKQFVNVTLNPVFSDFDGFVNYGSPINSSQQGTFGPETVQVTENAILMPIFSTQKVSTSLDVADGATIAFGSLIQDSIENVEDQTPVLGSIPIVGRLFQSKARKPTTTAIVFLVKVELMDPTGRPLSNR